MITKRTAPPHFPTMAELRARALPLLLAVERGGIVPYEALTEAMGVESRETRGRAAVLQAARQALRDDDRKVVNVRAVGYRVVAANEHAGVSRHEQRAADRRLRRALQTIAHVAINALTPDERADVLREQTRVGLKLAISRRLARVESLPPRADLKLPTGREFVERLRKRGA